MGRFKIQIIRGLLSIPSIVGIAAGPSGTQLAWQAAGATRWTLSWFLSRDRNQQRIRDWRQGR